jgi:hypothetical protein
MEYRRQDFFPITLDNATVNDAFVKVLRENLVLKGLLLHK